jgi:hypothetical protein
MLGTNKQSNKTVTKQMMNIMRALLMYGKYGVLQIEGKMINPNLTRASSVGKVKPAYTF